VQERLVLVLIENLAKSPDSLDFIGNLLNFLFAAFQTEKFETSWKFLDTVILYLGKQSPPKLFEKFVVSFDLMNPLAIFAFFKKVRDVTSKRNKKKEIADPLLEKNIFHILSNLIAVLPSNDHSALFDKAHIKDYVELLFLRWIGVKPENDVMCSVITSETWKYACMIMSKYTTLWRGCKHPEQVVSIFSNSTTQYQRALFDFVCLENPLASVDIAGVDLIRSMCSLNEIQDETLVNHIFKYFHQIMRSNINYQTTMIPAIGELLKRTPRLIKRVILNCHHDPLVKISTEEEEDKKKVEMFQKAIPKANSCYIEGVCLVLETNLSGILKETTLGHLALVSLSNMHSAVSGVRNGALKMMKILSRDTTTSIQMGNFLNIYTSEEETVYHTAAKRFCSYMSKLQIPRLTQDIFSEANQAILPLGSIVCENILTALVPWASNFGVLVKENDFEDFLRDMFAISVQLNGQYPKLIEELWVSVVGSTQSIDVCLVLVNHLCKEYSKGENKNLLLNLFVYICRTLSLEIVVSLLIKQLRGYSFAIEGDVLQWVVTRGVVNDSSYTPQEQYVMQILVHLTYEFDLCFVNHLPHLFLNALVLFGAVQSLALTESETVLMNLYQNLAIRHSNKNNFQECVAFLNNVKGKLVRDKVSLNKYLSGFCQLRPDLIQDVANLALDWSIKSPDKKISLESLVLFWNLNTEFDYELLETLSVIYFTSVQAGDDEKTILLLNIMKSIPNTYLKLSKPLTVVVYLTFWSFASANKKIYSLALEICEKILLIVPNDCLPEKINGTIQDAWKSESLGSDLALTSSLFKGLTSLETLDRTLDLFDIMMTRIPESSLLTANLLIGCVLYTCGELKGDKLAQISQEDDYFATLAEMNEPLKPHEVKTFVDEFCSIFKKYFKGHGNVYCNMLLQLLQNGKIAWQNTSLLLLAELLPLLWDENWTKDENMALITVLKECMHDQDEIFAEAAEKGMQFMMTALKCHYDMFNFLTKGILGYETTVKGRTWENRDIFVGINGIQQDVARREILVRIWTILFKKEDNKEFMDLIAKNTKETSIMERKRTGTMINPNDIRQPMMEKEFKQIQVVDDDDAFSPREEPKGTTSFLLPQKTETVGQGGLTRRISFTGVTKSGETPKSVMSTPLPLKNNTDEHVVTSPRESLPIVPKISFTPTPLTDKQQSKDSVARLKIGNSSSDDDDSPVMKITMSKRLSGRYNK
jgi:tetratricopeptide (TPR) repeat protein